MVVLRPSTMGWRELTRLPPRGAPLVANIMVAFAAATLLAEFVALISIFLVHASCGEACESHGFQGARDYLTSLRLYTKPMALLAYPPAAHLWLGLSAILGTAGMTLRYVTGSPTGIRKGLALVLLLLICLLLLRTPAISWASMAFE